MSLFIRHWRLGRTRCRNGPADAPCAGAKAVAPPAQQSAAEQARDPFTLVPDRGAPLTVAERSFHLAAAPNLCDLGGYRTRDRTTERVSYGRHERAQPVYGLWPVATEKLTKV